MAGVDDADERLREEPTGTDPYLWLEEITGDDALDWVRSHNEPTLAELCDARFEQMRAEALEVLDTDARIPYVRRRGIGGGVRRCALDWWSHRPRRPSNPDFSSDRRNNRRSPKNR